MQQHRLILSALWQRDFVTSPWVGGVSFLSTWIWARLWLLLPIAVLEWTLCDLQDVSWKAMHLPPCLLKYLSWQVASLMTQRPPYCEEAKTPVGVPVSRSSLWVIAAQVTEMIKEEEVSRWLQLSAMTRPSVLPSWGPRSWNRKMTSPPCPVQISNPLYLWA